MAGHLSSLPRLSLVFALALLVSLMVDGLGGLPAQASPDPTITIDSTADTNARNSKLTLREAILLATGGLSVMDLTQGECDQVSSTLWVGGLLGCVSFDPPGAASSDTIIFDTTVFPPGSPATINLGSTLPTLVGDDDTVEGSAAGVIVEGGGTATFDCFDINSHRNTIKGLEIKNCQIGVFMRFGVEGNIIGGGSEGKRNVISGNGTGVLMFGNNNFVRGNYIGTNASGDASAPNNVGVLMRAGAQNNSVEFNVISGNAAAGVQIEDNATRDNIIKGNAIGTNAGGDAAIANDIGVAIKNGAQNNIIGGTTEGERNVISGNTFGVLIEGAGSENNVVIGNYIGANAAGDSAIPNQISGVRIRSPAQNNTVGGTTEGERNVISGNSSGQGVALYASNNLVKGNYIGTNPAGTASIANGQGMLIQNGENNTIGGPTEGERNVISGNSRNVQIFGSAAKGNSVQGNYIGTNAAGDAALPNGTGVLISSGAQNNTIGGSSEGARNVISGNRVDTGVLIRGSGTDGNAVKGNYIGTNAAGDDAIPNDVGVVIEAAAKNNTIGGTAAGEGNLIAFNAEDGVRVTDATSTGNSIRGNSIHSNDLKGIENEDGGNTELPPPTITGFASVEGTACPNCTVDVYSDQEDEGEVYEGSAAADGAGNWSFPGSSQGPNVTATASDAQGNTSEFSEPADLSQATPTPTPAAGLHGDVDCDGDVDIGDGQKVARSLIDLPITQTEPCPEIGSEVASLFGDVDCDEDVDIGDAQKIARFLIALAVSQEPDCPAIGG